MERVRRFACTSIVDHVAWPMTTAVGRRMSGGIDFNGWIMHEDERMARLVSEFAASSFSGLERNRWCTHEHGCEHMTFSARYFVSLRTFCTWMEHTRA
jgi:hypothetical protein